MTTRTHGARASDDPLKGAARELASDLVALRRDLHRHPELAFQEIRTAGVVARYLEARELAPRRNVGRTGVVADIVGGGPGPTVLLRADMDALPIQERSGVEFSSTVANVMHACGHDAHTAALVGAATMLARRRGDLRGRVRLMFQPAEERLEGARAMIADGVLDGVDVAVSGHVFAGFPLGTVVRRPGPMMAGADLFEIEIAGVGGHAGAPQGSVNPITAAAQLLLALPTLVAYESAPGARVALTITAVESGRAANVVPDRLVMRGSLRWYDDQDRARLLERLGVLGRGICEAFRASFALSVTASVPVMVNAPRLLPAVDAAIAAAGAQALDAGPRGASEDFALVAERLPSFYVGVGAGGPQHPPHHSGTFDLDEDAVPLMAELFTRIALDVLHDDRVH